MASGHHIGKYSFILMNIYKLVELSISSYQSIFTNISFIMIYIKKISISSLFTIFESIAGRSDLLTVKF